MTRRRVASRVRRVEFDDLKSTARKALDGAQEQKKKAAKKVVVLGDPGANFWTFTEEDGFDLTHSRFPNLSSPMPYLRMNTVNTPIKISPHKTAMVIIDMQNWSLSQPLNGPNIGHDVEEVLIDRAIPAARRAGIQVVWLNWGLTQDDVDHMPPSLQRIFGFQMDGTPILDRGIGSDMGVIETENGQRVAGGRFLMKGHWNTALHLPLEKLRQASLRLDQPDELIYKTRICGMSENSSRLDSFLQSRGITTLLFGGVNVEFCVLATMAAANLRDYNTILLSDCTGTTNGYEPLAASLQVTRKGWGFCSSITDLEKGLDEMLDREADVRTKFPRCRPNSAITTTYASVLVNGR